jgi:hypothetical protein
LEAILLAMISVFASNVAWVFAEILVTVVVVEAEYMEGVENTESILD